MCITSYSNYLSFPSHSLFHANQLCHTHNCNLGTQRRQPALAFSLQPSLLTHTKNEMLRVTFTFFSFAINTIQETLYRESGTWPFHLPPYRQTLQLLLGSLSQLELLANSLTLTFSQMASLSLLFFGFLLFSNEVVGMRSDVLGEEMVMEEKELLGLFEVMDALVDDPEWAQAHPQPCTDTPWPGVECEVSNDPPIFHVTKIHVGPDMLSPPCKSSAYLSESLLKLTYLKTLSIFNCFVDSPVYLPSTVFGPFSTLEHLALQSNPTLFGEIPPSLGGVTTLRVLSLSQNNFQGNIPRQIGGLVSLEQLDLSYNNFSGLIPKEIGGLKSIAILDLSWNEIEGNLPSSLGQLQLLQKMDLSTNKLTGKIPPDLGNLKRLVLLDLSHNFIGGPIHETLSNLELLEYFLIDDNPIKSEIPQFIGNLRKLKSVSFSGCGLIGSIPNSFSSLKNLTALSLDNNSLSGSVPPNLGLLPNLDQLNISHNMLNGVLQLPDEFIGKLGKRLDVRGNAALCISSDKSNKKNLSFYLEIPSCVNIKPRNDKSFAEGPPEDPAGIKPSLYQSNISSSSSSRLDLQAIILSLVLNFILSFLKLFL